MKFICLVIIFIVIQINADAELVLSYNRKEHDVISKPLEKKLFLYELKHRNKKIVRDNLLQIYPDIKIISYEGSETIGVFATSERYSTVEKTLCNLDYERKQIMVEVEVIEISSNFFKESGIKWSDTTEYNSDGLILGDNDVYARIKLAYSRGEASLKANPSVVVLDSDKASFHVGDSIPFATPVNSNGETRYNVEFINSGMNLEITPCIVSGNYVRTKVTPEMSYVKGWKVTPAGEYPMISRKKASTVVDVKSSETFVIAGLKDSSNSKVLFKVPVIGDIPFLGNLFVSRSDEASNNELLFLIRPTIVQ